MTDPLEAKDWSGQGQGQEWSRPRTKDTIFLIWSANFPLFFSAKVFAIIAFRLVFDDNSKMVVFEV